MSYARRWGGRFTTNTASEAYQRQLTAPVHKWRKAWVSPTGLQPESSYKICKWVRVDQAADDDFANEGDEEGDEEGEEGDENEGEDGDEGEGEGEEGEGDGGDEGIVVEPKTGNGAVNGVEQMDVDQPVSSTLEVPGVATGASTPAVASPAANGTSPRQSVTPGTNGAIATPPIPSPAPATTFADHAPVESAPTLVSDTTAPAISPVPNVFSPKPKSPSPAHELPSNAIEITNVAPGGTELGLGDLGEGGVEITHPEIKSPSIPLPAELPPAEPSFADGDVSMGDPEPAVREMEAEGTDAGLTMADHEPERDFAVEGADEPREIAKEGE